MTNKRVGVTTGGSALWAPGIYTRPWTIAFAIARNKDSNYELLEEACHEGNQYTFTGHGRIGLKRYQGVVRPR